MPTNTTKLTPIVEEYLSDLRRLRASGAATGERSTYPALANLLNAVGATLRPKVFCVSELADQGAGHPDFGLYAAPQVQRGNPRKGQSPERGVVEVKSPTDDAWLTAQSDQVSRYWHRYRLTLVTNTRDFILLGEDANGSPARLETFSLARSDSEFEAKLQRPRAFARKVGAGLGEYLCRALSHRATLSEPGDLAWLLASYARDGLARVEAAGDTPSLLAVRSALEDALGVRFQGERGAAFFHSTLVQTLFYGVFSAWVLWSRRTPNPTAPFNWHEAAWELRVPVLRSLFQQLSDPGRLRSLGLVEVLDWTADALDRVDREAFFARFDEGQAVPYFYEPFLEAFDPALRRQLGVWYTPSEVVRYMVARVDMALRDDLGIPDGLAAENVYVLDPCCGTGAYVSETLRRIAHNLQDGGLGALVGARVKRAATERVFGFEIMPAPFVVAHLQVGLTMQDLDAPLSDSLPPTGAPDETERAGIFLTNALTGWEPTVQKPLPFPELEEERDRAERVKRDTPVLVILGNPPYNGFAGMAVDEERELSTAYRATRRVRRPEGQGLNDLYVRFFRMAERRITEKTGQGIVCFISNYSWLDGLSFTGMRERYLREFDTIRIDSLNGDKYRTGKVAPDGSPDPSIFSTQGNPIGIQVGTAITTLVRKTDHTPAQTVAFRNLWGQTKHEQLHETAHSKPAALYDDVSPVLQLGLPFAPIAASSKWHEWPALTELFPTSFPGVKTSRDPFLIDIDLDRLKARVADYFNADMSHEEIARLYPAVMRASARFDARSVRNTLLRRGGPRETGFIQHAYRPFDTRWLYWDADTKLLDEKRAEYKPHVFDGNLWLSAVPRLRRDSTEPQSAFTSHIASLHLNEWSASMFPAYLRDDGLGVTEDSRQVQNPDSHPSFPHTQEPTPRTPSNQHIPSPLRERARVRVNPLTPHPPSFQRRPNLSPAAQKYLERIGANVEDLFHHVLAVLHDPTYREANAGALRMEWPRIPIPGWPNGDDPRASDKLAESAARGRQLAALLDTDTLVPGVTTGTLRPDIALIAVPTTTDGTNMTGPDFDLTVGWGHFGAGQAVMPGQGRIIERPYTPQERATLGDTIPTLGHTTLDIHLNHRTYWRNVPTNVWTYKLGGYQPLKKWLSYRERKVLGRPLLPEEAQHFTEATRRIASILELTKKK